jgi:hypothetical protein
LDRHCCQSPSVAIPAITNSQNISHLLGKIPLHNSKLEIIKVILFSCRRTSIGAEGSEEGNRDPAESQPSHRESSATTSKREES